MIILVTGMFPIYDRNGYETGKFKFGTSHGYDTGAGRTVITSGEPPKHLGGEWDVDLQEWVIYT